MKKFFTTALATAAIAASSLAFAPSPVRADNVIASGSNGCATFRHYQAWWGQYIYLNQCAANQVADFYGVYNDLIGNITRFVPSRFGRPVNIAVFYSRTIRNNLRTCASRNGQAYLRFYGSGTQVIPYVSCN